MSFKLVFDPIAARFELRKTQTATGGDSNTASIFEGTLTIPSGAFIAFTGGVFIQANAEILLEAGADLLID